MLYETAKAIQQNDFNDVQASSQLIQQIEMVIDFYEAHAYHENTIVMPAIMAYNPELVRKFEAEHEEDHALGEKLLTAVRKWKNAGTDDERFDAGQAILYAFNDFSAFNIAHMNKEELILNQELWKYLSDESIMAFTPKIVQTIEPKKLMMQNQWIFLAINAKEALMMLQGAKKTMPDAAYAGMLTLAEQNLAPEKWTYVKAHLD